MEKIIYVNAYLTSAEFYGSLLPEAQIVLRYYDKISNVVIDFSGTCKIDPNVIPNLLCLGRVMKSLLGYEATIRIPDTFDGGRIKFYLYQIKFLEKAKGIFLFESDPYTGFVGRMIDPLCGTVCLHENVDEDGIGNVFDSLVNPFAMKYLRDFDKEWGNDNDSNNIVLNLLKELAANAAQHGKSYSYTTVHAKFSKNRIYIAISDSGKGFLQSCKEEHADKLLKKNEILHNEVDAIVYCTYLRAGSKKFGLYAAIVETLHFGGIVRIHSNDSQIIFTPQIKEQFESKTLLQYAKFWKYNVKRNIKFSGTHIEIEIPFQSPRR